MFFPSLLVYSGSNYPPGAPGALGGPRGVNRVLGGPRGLGPPGAAGGPGGWPRKEKYSVYSKIMQLDIDNRLKMKEKCK